MKKFVQQLLTGNALKDERKKPFEYVLFAKYPSISGRGQSVPALTLVNVEAKKV